MTAQTNKKSTLGVPVSQKNKMKLQKLKPRINFKTKIKLLLLYSSLGENAAKRPFPYMYFIKTMIVDWPEMSQTDPDTRNEIEGGREEARDWSKSGWKLQ